MECQVDPLQTLLTSLRDFGNCVPTRLRKTWVLCKYGIDSNDIKKIPPFVPEPVKINNEHFQYCLRMGIISPAKSSNDIYIVKNITRQRISLEHQFEVVGEEALGRVDYAIKKIIDSLNEELVCITEVKQ